MNHSVAAQNLSSIAERLRSKEPVEQLTVREFLSWFEAKRRGYWVVRQAREALKNAQLKTEPDFEGIYIDTPIKFLLSPVVVQQDATAPGAILEVTTSINLGSASGTADTAASNSTELTQDPTHRISKLAAANRTPLSVSPDAQLATATTMMLVRGFSQLPVMTSPRDVKGVISWQSIGHHFSRGINGKLVRDMMDQHHQEVSYDASVFKAIPEIVSNDYVLVRAKDKTISGIVTASDLSLQFLQLSEPFLLLGEIENHLRQIISDAFDINDLKSAQDNRDSNRDISSVADLNFGEYKALLDKQERWEKSGLPWDRRVFCDQLEAIREIRNDVMHFDPDPLTEAELQTLREFAKFLQRNEGPRQ